MLRILGRKGANMRVSGTLFKAVYQGVIFLGSKTWVMNPHMGRALWGVHHKVALLLIVNQPRSIWEGSWQYSLFEEEIREGGSIK